MEKQRQRPSMKRSTKWALGIIAATTTFGAALAFGVAAKMFTSQFADRSETGFTGPSFDADPRWLLLAIPFLIAQLLAAVLFFRFIRRTAPMMRRWQGPLGFHQWAAHGHGFPWAAPTGTQASPEEQEREEAVRQAREDLDREFPDP